MVSIPYDPHFAQTYRTLCQTPLLNAQGETEPAHLMEGCATVPVDGLFLRDPQCLLFKQFARQDTENSPSGRGFIFTAVVYSRDKNNEANQGNYFFSLDPEAIPGAHLYPLWTRLQERELGTIAKCEEEARWEFRARARGPKPGCFKDPWFDGGPYLATIVVTPGRGTSIGPAGTAADLSDDPVVRIATDLFEATQWSGRQYLGDYPSRPSGHLIPHPQTTNVLTEPRPLMDGAYRFVAIGLRPALPAL